MNKKETIVLLKQLGASFVSQFDFPSGDKERDKPVVDTWHDKLKPYDKDLVMEAVDWLCTRQRQYPPNLYQILGEVKDILEERRKEKKFEIKNELGKLQEKAIDGELTEEESERLVSLQDDLSEIENNIYYLKGGEDDTTTE